MGEIVDITRGIYRRVYSGFITGRRICSVSVEAEAWFWRIQAVADDFGNLPGDALLVWQSTVGRRGVTMQSVSKWIDELVGAGLLLRYSENGESYLHITYWSQESWPASKNGRRAQRYPRPAESGGIRGNPGESRNIQGSPGESGCYQYQYQNQDKDQDHTDAATRKPRRQPDAGIGWDKSGGFTGVGDEQRKAWSDAYPSAGIDAELAKAHAWLIANPARAGKRNWSRFLTGWLARAHERTPRIPDAGPRAADPDDDPKPPPMTQQEIDDFTAFMRREKAKDRAMGVGSG
jgi:hypothetical protein